LSVGQLQTKGRMHTSVGCMCGKAARFEIVRAGLGEAEEHTAIITKD
jgi:hypothetical protein